MAKTPEIKNLVIVESPAKAKTIEGFLGKDYIVKASYGHVRDLPKGNNAIDIENNFNPRYEVSEDKLQVVEELRKISKKAESVWLATDEDREGEAISWHLFEVLGLSEKSTKRIVFHEITKKAIQHAIDHPRNINLELVNAQQARRVLDRLVGFELSPLLWSKVKAGLSAGRVQSVAVRLIVEREREMNAFAESSAFKVTAEFALPGNKILKAELPKSFKTESEAKAFLEKCTGASYEIASLEKKPGKKSPSAPFTTSTLQQEASRKLGFSVSQTMVLAQRLYESGKITYMRTDSFNLSDTALAEAKEVILKDFGKEYHQVRKYKTKSASAQEAHEAIRPTDFSVSEIEGEKNEKRLYELIWKRTVASQMADAEIEKTIAEISILPSDKKEIYFNAHTLVATGEVIKFQGFLKVYIESTDEDEDEGSSGMLPPLDIGQILSLTQIAARERFARPPARFTEASLVKKLEELGIGRPSTYAPTISTIERREYVIKGTAEGKPRKYTVLYFDGTEITKAIESEMTGSDKGKLLPTDMGTVVTDFLVEYFRDIIDYSFTAEVEREFDEIAEGKMVWNKMIQSFYTDFHKKVTETKDTAERASGERMLGDHPVTGRPVSVRLARYGPIVQISDPTGEEKPLYANLRGDLRMETITLEQALDLFKLPREAGQFEEEPMVIGTGRFGPYIRHKGKFYSLPKTEDPMLVEAPRCVEIIEAKRKAEAERVIQSFEEGEIQVLKGRFGPYVSYKGDNLKLPKDKDPVLITLAEIHALQEAQANAPVKTKIAAKKAGGKKSASAKPKAKPKVKPKSKS